MIYVRKLRFQVDNTLLRNTHTHTQCDKGVFEPDRWITEFLAKTSWSAFFFFFFLFFSFLHIFNEYFNLLETILKK